MIGIYILFFRCFLSKKRTKGEISDRFSAKTHYNRTTIFTKRKGFLCLVQRVFLTSFWSIKDQNVRFQADLQWKPIIIERQFSQNVTVFYSFVRSYPYFFNVFLRVSVRQRGLVLFFPGNHIQSPPFLSGGRFYGFFFPSGSGGWKKKTVNQISYLNQHLKKYILFGVR